MRGAAVEPRVAMADASSLCLARTDTDLSGERTVSLGMGTCLLRELETLELLRTEALESLESLGGTVFVHSMRRGGGGAGSWNQYKRLS